MWVASFVDHLPPYRGTQVLHAGLLDDFTTDMSAGGIPTNNSEVFNISKLLEDLTLEEDSLDLLTQELSTLKVRNAEDLARHKSPAVSRNVNPLVLSSRKRRYTASPALTRKGPKRKNSGCVQKTYAAVPPRVACLSRKEIYRALGKMAEEN